MYAIRRITIDIAIESYKADEEQAREEITQTSAMDWIEITTSDNTQILGTAEAPATILYVPKPPSFLKDN
jgi:hypothetical protein